MSDRDEFERVFKSVFKGHRMTRGSNGDYIGIVPWSAWKIWQAQRPAPVVLHEDMTEDFKEQWQNGLPLDSAEARWAFCGWKAARAQQAGSGEAVAYRVTECPGLTYLVDTIEDAEHGKAFYGYGYEALYTHPSASMPNLSTIAQKKLDQMGATVHGVLVKNEAGAWAAVSDAGRVMWLDGFELQAARAQQAGSGEAVAHDWVDCPVCGEPDMQRTTHEREQTLVHCCNANCLSNGGTNASAIAHPRASVPDGWRHTLKEALAMMTSQPMTLERQADAVTGIRDLLATAPQHADNRPLPVNRFGVDADYFTKNLEILIRDMANYTPSELSRSLGRLAMTANSETMREPEFNIGDLSNEPRYRDSATTPQPADNLPLAISDVLNERKRQDRKWGGPEHDDQKSPNDFVQHIEDYARWARVMAGMDSFDKYRRRMVQVAALAVAAVEATDRALKRPNPPAEGAEL